MNSDVSGAVWALEWVYRGCAEQGRRHGCTVISTLLVVKEFAEFAFKLRRVTARGAS